MGYHQCPTCGLEYDCALLDFMGRDPQISAYDYGCPGSIQSGDCNNHGDLTPEQAKEAAISAGVYNGAFDQ